MKPTPVAVNKAEMYQGEHTILTMKVGTPTINNLGRYFHPEPLSVRIMKVDDLREE